MLKFVSSGGCEDAEPGSVGGEESVVGWFAAFDRGDGGEPGVEVVGGVLEAHSGAVARRSRIAGVGDGVRVGDQMFRVTDSCPSLGWV